MRRRAHSDPGRGLLEASQAGEQCMLQTVNLTLSTEKSSLNA